MSSELVGQAVVTDPGGASAGGYVLVAASPSVTAEERSFLEHNPGISEHLHRIASPGPYFSSFCLPGGRPALVRRFVAGERRGLNRVVVHLLVLPEPLLAHLGGDAWLLASACRYRLPDGQQLSLAELGQLAAAAGLQELPDLACLPPEEPRQASRKAMTERRGFLLGRWGEERLGQTLGWLFDVLARGQRALLPQDLEHEQLLALAVTALPVADRLQEPWTTHFAPGMPVLFRLANAPDPEEARQLHRNREEWRLLPLQLRPLDRPGLHPAAVALAQLVVVGNERLAALLADPGADAPSLLREASDLDCFLSWWAHDSQLVREGFPNPTELHRFLTKARPGSQRNRWLNPAVVLYATVRTGQRLTTTSQAFDRLTATLGTELAQSGWAPLMPGPAALTELSRHTGFEALDVRGLLLAAVLVRGALPAPPAATPERETLLDLFLAAPLGDLVTGGHAPAVVELRRLALELGRCRSARTRQALARLAAVSGALEAAIPDLGTHAGELPAAAPLLAELLAQGQRPAAARLMAEKIVPMLCAAPEAASDLDPELLERGLKTLEVLGDIDRIAVLNEARTHLNRGGSLSYPVLKALCQLAEDAQPELRLVLETAVLKGRLANPAALANALQQLDALAAALDPRSAPRGSEAPSASALKGSLQNLLHDIPREQQASWLIEVLLMPQVPQTVKLALERGLLESSLRVAGRELSLPHLDLLAQRGNLLLAVAVYLGQHWDQRPTLAETFLADALQQGRLDAAQALLDAAVPRERRGEDGFLRHLAEVQPRGLPQSLLRLVDENAGGAWRLERHARRLYLLMSAAGSTAGRPFRRSP